MYLRPADFAGSWYPDKSSDCKRIIEEFIEQSLTCPDKTREPAGGILPHAGWVFSGKTACNVIQCLSERTTPDTVIIFGRHLHPGSPNYLMTGDMWDTPLGPLEIDHEFASSIADAFPFSIETANHYEPDNTIELQLPFIKYFFPQTMIFPVGLPPKPASLEIGKKITETGQNLNRNMLIIGSTDLTHYGYNYGYTPKGIGREAVDWVKNENDRKIIDRILAMDAEGVINDSLQNHNACCGGAVAAAIAAVKQIGATTASMLSYHTSYDIRPDSSFVGYTGIVFKG
jgi:AmmeMemoRadiSam system protein B